MIGGDDASLATLWREFRYNVSGEFIQWSSDAPAGARHKNIDITPPALYRPAMISELFNLALNPVIRVNHRGRFTKKWPSKDEIRAFYRSKEWKHARYKQLVHSSRCAACGTSAQDGAHMNVDHIKPLHQYWDLRLNSRNLQTLCASCNWGKGPTDKDWRVQSKKRLSKASRTHKTSAWKR